MPNFKIYSLQILFKPVADGRLHNVTTKNNYITKRKVMKGFIAYSIFNLCFFQEMYIDIIIRYQFKFM